jgi:hypothetical protein
VLELVQGLETEVLVKALEMVLGSCCSTTVD